MSTRVRRGNFFKPLINGTLKFLHGVKFELVSRNAFLGTQKDLVLGIVVSRKCRSGFVQTDEPLWLEERIPLSHIYNHLKASHWWTAMRPRFTQERCRSLIEIVEGSNDPNNTTSQELRCLLTRSLIRNAVFEIAVIGDSVEFAVEYYGYVSQGRFPEVILNPFINQKCFCSDCVSLSVLQDFVLSDFSDFSSPEDCGLCDEEAELVLMLAIR